MKTILVIGFYVYRFSFDSVADIKPNLEDFDQTCKVPHCLLLAQNNLTANYVPEGYLGGKKEKTQTEEEYDDNELDEEIQKEEVEDIDEEYIEEVDNKSEEKEKYPVKTEKWWKLWD